ncbi:MAG: D-aminoacyl-tRNA deacylase [Pseudomonadota bacterium]|jgi:D-tyrosyl-tRNA(Tyr) deacylase|nr:MAG: D-tyrosyl-tRNA(Tyr) deacylase [Pseudomonadota bacterium]
MIALIQRVSRASVAIEGETVGAIERGILALVGVAAADTPENGGRLLEKVLNYRIFPDDAGKMNLSLRQIGGGLLLVPQFTLLADTAKGTRPGFSRAAPPERASALFADLIQRAGAAYPQVASGRFGADMQVELVNDGPVTFWLEVA